MSSDPSLFPFITCQTSPSRPQISTPSAANVLNQSCSQNILSQSVMPHNNRTPPVRASLCPGPLHVFLFRQQSPTLLGHGVEFSKSGAGVVTEQRFTCSSLVQVLLFSCCGCDITSEPLGRRLHSANKFSSHSVYLFPRLKSSAQH